MHKKLAVIGAVCAMFTANVSAGTLRLATEPTFAPFEFVNSKTGEVTGFDIELAKLLASKNGDTVEVLGMGFDAIIPALMTGMADIGVAAITITEERSKKILFTDPYYEGGLSIVIRKSDTNKIKGPENLKNQTICVQIGTSGFKYSSERIPGSTVRSFNSITEAYMELRNGGCRAVVNDRPVNGYFMAKTPDSDKAFTHLSTPIEAERLGIAIAKKNSELHDRLNKALQEVKANGEYDQLYQKWFGR